MGCGLYGLFPRLPYLQFDGRTICRRTGAGAGPLRHLLAAGRFREIHQWLATRIHRFGAIYPPGELVKRATGEPLRSTYFINYLREKYTEVYQLKKQ